MTPTTTYYHDALKPWLTEPNRLDWTDEATGLKCLILRHDSGHLCGYVQVPRVFVEQGWFEAIDCHGGLTGGFVDDEGEWAGFDCGHIEDFRPYGSNADGAVYRDVEYVRGECGKVAGQLRAQAQELDKA